MLPLALQALRQVPLPGRLPRVELLQQEPAMAQRVALLRAPQVQALPLRQELERRAPARRVRARPLARAPNSHK